MTGSTLKRLSSTLLCHVQLSWWRNHFIAFADYIGTGDLPPATAIDPFLRRLWLLIGRRSSSVRIEDFHWRLASGGTALESE